MLLRASQRKGTILGRVFFLAIGGFLTANTIATYVLVTASIANYPGGHSLSRFNEIYKDAERPGELRLENDMSCVLITIPGSSRSACPHFESRGSNRCILVLTCQRASTSPFSPSSCLELDVRQNGIAHPQCSYLKPGNYPTYIRVPVGGKGMANR